MLLRPLLMMLLLPPLMILPATMPLSLRFFDAAADATLMLDAAAADFRHDAALRFIFAAFRYLYAALLSRHASMLPGC